MRSSVWLLLLPVDIVTKFWLQPFDVKTKHPVHAELAELSRVALSERGFFLGRELVIGHDRFEIRERLFVDGFFHLEIEQQSAQLVTTHSDLQLTNPQPVATKSGM